MQNIKRQLQKAAVEAMAMTEVEVEMLTEMTGGEIEGTTTEIMIERKGLLQFVIIVCSTMNTVYSPFI